MTVPPVPTPATKASATHPTEASCATISGPVVCSWAQTLASLANWRGRKTPGVSRANCSAMSMLPRKPPCSRDTGMISAPKDSMSTTRSRLIQSGMKMRTRCRSARPSAANETPVLPLVASAIVPPGSSSPVSYACRRMQYAMRSLTLPVMFRCSYLA
jgi:hypothetical protein